MLILGPIRITSLLTNVQSLLADLNAEANVRLEAFLLSDNARIAAASNEDDDEELSSHIPIPEDDDGQSYHSSDEESGNEVKLGIMSSKKFTGGIYHVCICVSVEKTSLFQSKTNSLKTFNSII